MALAEAQGSIPSKTAALAAQGHAVFALSQVVDKLSSSDRNFAQSLISQFHKGKPLSENQLPWVAKLTERGQKPAASAAPMLDAPGAWEAFMASVAPDAEDAALSFLVTIDGVQRSLRLARRHSSKGDYAALETTTVAQPKKSDWTYAGALLPSGQFKPYSKTVDALLAKGLLGALDAFAADPMTALVEFGKTTGICGCCGRKLTDPKSVAAGIGPVCSGKVAGWSK